METIKEFLKYLDKTDTKVLNYEDFLNELRNTHERTFTGSLKTNILTPKDGLISIDMFLDNLFSYDTQGHFLSNSEIKKLKNNTNYTLDDERYTFNDWYTFSEKADYLAHDINMNMFINDSGSYLVLLQVQIGLDKRSGFSNYVAIKFDTKEDYENAFVYGSTEYKLASCLVKTQEGKTYNVKVTSEPLETLAYMSVMNNATMKEAFNTDIYCANLGNIEDEIDDYIRDDKDLAKNFHVKEFTNYNGTVKIDL